MERLERYRNGYRDDFILNKLEENGIDIEKYLIGGKVENIIINNKDYQIFYAKDKHDIETAVMILEKNKIIKDLEIKALIKSLDNKNEKKKKFSIKNFSEILQGIIEKINITGDIVYDGRYYKQAPMSLGKPTSNKKDTVIKARVTEEQFKKLNTYCIKKNINISEAIRNLINFCDTK